MWRLAVCVAMIVMSCSAFAASATSANGDQENWTDRRAAAREYANLFREIESAIPTLSPSERQWAEAEYAAMARGDSTGSRQQAFINSREYTLSELLKHIAEIRTVVGEIQLSQSTGNIKRETFKWISLIYLFSQEENTGLDMETLLSKRVIKKDDFPPRLGVIWLTGSADGQVQMIWHWWARAIWEGFLSNLAKDRS